MQQCPGGSPYVIQPGDTLWSIARVRNLSLDAIIRANPGMDPDNLRVGQVICLPVPSPARCGPGLVPYTIQPGDTLFSLQQRGIISSLQQTLRDNPGLDPANLRVGQVMCVPGAPGPSPAPGVCPAPSRQYVVQPGDTLFAIAQRFGVSVARIQGANPAVDPNNLRVGQVICIPGAPGPGPAPGVCPAPSRQYVAQPGDTLFTIAQRFGVSVARIQGANPAVDPNNLQVGQVICIPGA